MKNNWILIVVALLVLSAGFILVSSKNKRNTVNTPTTSPVSTQTNTTSSSITIEGGMFYFKPNVITVKKGEVIRINFSNVEGQHDFVIDELNVKSKLVSAGKTETIEFTPDKTGEFEFYCSVGNHKKMGLVGKLIVED